jgi:hypothetical protein
LAPPHAVPIDLSGALGLVGCFTFIVATVFFGFFSVLRFSFALVGISLALVALLLLYRIVPVFARKTFGITKRLLERFSLLSPAQRITVLGFIVSVGGMLLWTLGYVVSARFRSVSVLRPVGVITLIVGLGILSLGIVFSLSKPSKVVDE